MNVLDEAPLKDVLRTKRRHCDLCHGLGRINRYQPRILTIAEFADDDLGPIEPSFIVIRCRECRGRGLL